jgi:hypothetical protein
MFHNGTMIFHNGTEVMAFQAGEPQDSPEKQVFKENV